MKMKKAIPAMPVVNISSAVKFYQGKLGFAVDYQEEGFARMIRDEVEIHLWSTGDESWKSRDASMVLRPVLTGAESFLAGTASCRIEVQGLDKLYEEYKTQAILHQNHATIVEQAWGQRDFATLDLHGNLLTFYETIK